MASTDAADPAVARVVDVADLVADQQGADPEQVLLAALSKVRQRGDGDE